MTSRDLRPIFDEVRGLLSCRDLELTMMLVYDRETDSWEALDDNSDVGNDATRTLQESYKIRKSIMNVLEKEET